MSTHAYELHSLNCSKDQITGQCNSDLKGTGPLIPHQENKFPPEDMENKGDFRDHGIIKPKTSSKNKISMKHLDLGVVKNTEQPSPGSKPRADSIHQRDDDS